jgi:hypothetical protein
MSCPRCGLEQPQEHRYCAGCGRRLSDPAGSGSPKVTRWFRSLPVHPDDPADALLRVSRYLDEVTIETDEGSVRVPSHHVRFSVWSGDRALCAISIPDDEADGLVEFLRSNVARSSDVDAGRATPSV